MNLYKISQSERDGYDTYDSAIVVANNGEEARAIHPSGHQSGWEDDTKYMPCWASSPLQVSSRYIGKAAAIFTSPCVVLASFNAG